MSVEVLNKNTPISNHGMVILKVRQILKPAAKLHSLLDYINLIPFILKMLSD